MKCKCWSSPKGFDFGCHALRVRLGLRAFGPSPNVFVLALFFSPEWVPDVFFSDLKGLNHSGSAGPYAAPATTSNVHANWHHLMSHNCFKVKLHPFKPVLHITQRKKCLPSIYSWMKTTKTKMGHVQVIMDPFYSQWWEQHVQNGRGRGGIISARHICMIPDFEMEKSKQSFLEQKVNSLAVSSRPGMDYNHHFSYWFRPSKAVCSITIS